jgi:hypothetical protein
MLELEKKIHEKLVVLDGSAIAAHPHAVPVYVHDWNGSDSLVPVEKLAQAKADALMTLKDYAQALFEIASTAQRLANACGYDVPEFTRIVKNAKLAAKQLPVAAQTATAINNAKDGE